MSDEIEEIERKNREALTDRELVQRVIRAQWEREHANRQAGARRRVPARPRWQGGAFGK
jgi:hypothetical protein